MIQGNRIFYPECTSCAFSKDSDEKSIDGETIFGLVCTFKGPGCAKREIRPSDIIAKRIEQQRRVYAEERDY